MIGSLNDEIDIFLSSLTGLEESSFNQIKERYSSTVTDDLSKGHLTTNVCMIAASQLKKNPKELADKLQRKLIDSRKFEKVETAGPGFINITLKREDFISTIDNINLQSSNFGSSNHVRINQYKLNLFQQILPARFMLAMEEVLHMAMLLEEFLNPLATRFKKNITLTMRGDK